MEIDRNTPPKDARTALAISGRFTASNHYQFPLLTILAGILFSLFLYWHIQDELFFSGDGALKALLTKQFSTGNFHFNLELSAQSWIRKLWDQGLYPFEPPFAYKISDLHYITFSFIFPLVTVPFYALLGFKGLYIVPLLATWILWIGFYFVCRNFQMGSAITTVAIATLIFASPLTMYSSMYWEHTLAISLAFNGLAILLVRGLENFSIRDAVLSGLLIGLSVWFREELLCVVGIVFVLVAASVKFNLGQFSLISKNKTIFLLSMMVTVLTMWGVNLLVYHHFLGIHSIQVTENFSLTNRVTEAYKIFGKLTVDLIDYFPTIYFCIAYVILYLALFKYQKIEYFPIMGKLLLIFTAFTVFVSLFLPSNGGRQWGTRFLLINVPIICLFAGIALHATWKIRRFGLRYISALLFTIFFSIGFYINTYLGPLYCYPHRENSTSTTLKFLQQDKNQFVATPNQYINQTFEVLFDKKAFFLTKNNEELTKLGWELHKQGHQKLIYICPSYDPCSKRIPDAFKIGGGVDSLSLNFSKMKNIETQPMKKKFGRVEKNLIGNVKNRFQETVNYMIYEASIVEDAEKKNSSLQG